MTKALSTLQDVAGAMIALTPRIARGFPTRVMAGQDYKAGLYYPSTLPGVTSMAAKVANATARMYFSPFFCRSAHIFTAIGFLNGASVNGHKFHYGIYTSVGGYPSALIVDSGELTVGDAGTGTLRTVTISQLLAAMTPYWLAWQSNTDSQSAWSPAALNYDLSMELGFLGVGSSSILGGSDSAITGYSATNAYGALPATAPAVTNSTDALNDIAPLMFLKG